MKKLLIILILVLVGGGLGVYGLKVAFLGPLNGICQTRAPLIAGWRPGLIDALCPPVLRDDKDIASSKVAVLCSWTKHKCSFITPSVNSGDLKVIITVNGKAGKKIEIDTWSSPQPGSNNESYVKYTDDNGIALFKGIPVGVYYLSTNSNTFPKEYGDAERTLGIPKAEVIKGETTQITIDLHSNP